MDKNNQYWVNRTQKNEDKAQRLAATYSKRQEILYKQTYKKIENQLNALYTQITDAGAGTLTRTQLWQYNKYMQLRNAIDGECKTIGANQLTLMDETINKVFTQTLNTTLEDLKPDDRIFTFLRNTQTKQYLNSAWSGKNYSARVWDNTNHLASQLNKHLEDMIVLGKMPEQIKAQIMADMNVGYNVADRLIRTEASYAYNTASITSYKLAGVKEVEYIPEDDEQLCDECEANAAANDGIYLLGTEPQLPVHPNCRCCYAPVVEL
jgi:SPP1 gp7 family putative phage head morphogenesis protein